MYHLLNSFPPNRVKYIVIEPHYVLFPDLRPYHHPIEGINYGAISSPSHVVVKNTFTYGPGYRKACHVVYKP